MAGRREGAPGATTGFGEPALRPQPANAMAAITTAAVRGQFIAEILLGSTIAVSRMHVAAIIAAGGRGQRLGADRPKQFLEIGGASILDLSLRALAASDRIDEIVVALPHDYVAETAQEWQGRSAKPLVFVEGGERRQDSVARAFAKTSPDADIIVIHDAARPFVTGDIIARTIDAAVVHGAAIAAIPVTDTVKQIGEAVRGSRRIRATIARETIVLAQTPQAFRRGVLEQAIAEGLKLDATDESMLVERLGLAGPRG